MKYRSESEIKQALGIDTWRNLSRDKMISFVAMMPDLDTEVALKVIEQFPAFKDFAKDAVSAIERAHAATLSANDQSQDHVHRACQEVREILRGELNKDDLSWEERKFIYEQLQETARMQFQKDSENKQFLDGQFKKVLVGAAGALALCVAFVGGRVMAGSNDDSAGSPD
ncbi:hypothetical protein V2W30_36615 [Streptomyces sp. Q6]|uniref:Uncharacterized protein n=1 Tax=Streptomyces citrinus TaxID=3118173 RepID=A0ACD5AM56_9ACTN